MYVQCILFSGDQDDFGGYSLMALVDLYGMQSIVACDKKKFLNLI
jgi:hypothetical protein